ncbi:MAG: hypothetical protein Q4C06_08340 [Bacillota bacterium]|nr:hypothetical protein [Bacillota bacterium]
MGQKEKRRYTPFDMGLKEGDRFKATDRVGRVSTWKLRECKRDIHYVLEAVEETYRTFERCYLLSMRRNGKWDEKRVEQAKQKKDFCTIEVGPAWFYYRKIELLEKEGYSG